MLLHKLKYFARIFIVATYFISCAGKNEKEKIAVSTSDTAIFYPVNSQDTLQLVYDTTISYLWKKFVPISGQAATVQGELVRAIERLENEIAGNAKANWDTSFVLIAEYLRDTLIQSKLFPGDIEKEITDDINALIRNDNEVITEKYYYDRLRRRIVEWYWYNKTPRKHKFNPSVYI